MTKPFDDRLRDLRMSRAHAAGFAPFLHSFAADEVNERLTELTRAFEHPALIGGQGDAWGATLGPQTKTAPAADTLELEEAAHDLVVHALSLQAQNDPVGQLIQCRRALQPDGFFIGVMLGGRTLYELRDVLIRAETELRGGVAPRVAPMGDLRDLGALLQRAGFALPVADSMPLNVTYETAFHLMRDLRAMGETNVLSVQDKRIPPRALFARAAELYENDYPAPDGRITASFELVFLSGWAPSPDQQQPLRPGSAKTRLADALGVPELPAGEKP